MPGGSCCRTSMAGLSACSPGSTTSVTLVLRLSAAGVVTARLVGFPGWQVLEASALNPEVSIRNEVTRIWPRASGAASTSRKAEITHKTDLIRVLQLADIGTMRLQGDSVLNLPPAQGLAEGLRRIQNVVRIGKQRFADAVGGWRGGCGVVGNAKRCPSSPHPTHPG